MQFATIYNFADLHKIPKNLHKESIFFHNNIIENLKNKVNKVFPKVTFPPWLHPVKMWYQTVSG